MTDNRWFNAHVYCQTKAVKIDGKDVECISTGKLARIDGDDKVTLLTQEIFPSRRYPRLKANLYMKALRRYQLFGIANW